MAITSNTPPGPRYPLSPNENKVAEISDEVIIVADIIERARQEAGVDVTGLEEIQL